MAKENEPNVIALIEFRLKGRKVQKGEVVSKDDFPSNGDWRNLAHMTPARVEETLARVGKPQKAGKAAMPGSGK